MVMLVLWMIAAGVIVVVMRVVVAMIVVAVGMMVVVMPMIMVVIVIVIVIMAVMVGLRRVALGLRIGPAFGIERRLERDHAGAETLGHRFDHGIAADAERLWQYFGRQMAVTEVPADADQRQWVSGPDLRQRLGLGDHFHHASVLEPQTVAAAQHCRFREVEQEFEPADAGHGDAPAITCVEVEHDRIRRGARPMAGRNHFVSPQHHCTFWKRGPIEPSLDEKRSKRQPACKPGSVWPGLIAPT
jgi:hypothetical protein